MSMQEIQNADLVSVIQEINFATELETTHLNKLIKVLLIFCAMKTFVTKKMFKQIVLSLVSVCLPNILYP